MVLAKLLLSATTTLLAFGLYKAVQFIVRNYASPLQDLPGPASSNWIYGNLKEIFDADNSVLHEKWAEEYGSTLKYSAMLNIPRLFTMDTRALNHILTHSDIYQKPPLIRENLSRILGTGVLIVEGDQHRHQRKILNPAFGPIQVRALTEIFIEKSVQLRDRWSSEISNNGGKAHINVVSWLSRMTLDVIGLAGFKYHFDALDDKPNELNKAFATLFQGDDRTFLTLLQAWFPFLRMIRTERDRKIEYAQKTMRRIGTQLLREAKESYEASKKDGSVEHSEKARDLFSLLIHANMEGDTSQRLADEDVLAQVPTFLVAGHETTSSAVTWTLYSLTQHPEVQIKLRAELTSVSTSNPTMDELNSLSYLDNVVRESLRVHSPVSNTIRLAMQDDVIPLGTPIVDKKGVTRREIKINKGDTVFVPILAINRCKELWGDDGKEFKPERWQSSSENVSSIPGIWGNQLTFLGGPRSCIGYRFSLVEMKALIFTLVRAFEFELAIPVKDLGKKTGVVQRPVVLTDPEPRMAQLPLIVRLVQDI